MNPEEKEIYKQRFKEEFKLIKQKGFVRYFLIIEDLIDFCNNKNILTGPGRGSVGGSLIAYLLNITKVDPIEHNLLFSRFISENRQDIPDVDIDFQDTKRTEVRQRLKELYGENQIAGISTYMEMAEKAVIKDISRAYDIPFFEVNNFTKTIVENIEEAIEITHEGREFNKKYPDVIKHALKLRGNKKSLGQHAAAILIAPEDLNNGTQAYLANRKGVRVVGWDGEDAEHVGLLKLDVLGLSTLSVISYCLELIKKNQKKDIDIFDLPLDDENVFSEISAGNTVGCFQISTGIMTKLIKEMKVNTFNELSIALALCRPGPLDSGMTEEYIARKNEKEWTPKHPIFEEITAESLGICCYQEQVMAVINKVAGLPYSTADKIRKIIGKKRDITEFQQYQDMFVQGCLEQGTLSEKEALDFWTELGYHANYSFAKAHSTAYAMISYQTAWLKYHYPTEFLCASLTYGSESQKEALVKEAQRIDLEIVSPKLDVSDPDKWVAKDGKLFIPFLETKGIGPKMVDKIKEYQEINNSGFFETKELPVFKGKQLQMLKDIGAFGDNPVDDIDNYFDLGIAIYPEKKYPNLYNKLGTKRDYSIQKLLSGDIKDKHFTRGVKPRNLTGLKDCKLCEGREHCKKPVPGTFGEFNIMILDEVPGWPEDKVNKQMVSDACTKILFPALYGYGYERTDFYLTSVVKCGKIKKPELKIVNTCKRWFLKEVEIVKPFLILGMGNTAVKLFKGQETGIQRLNGTTEWNEEIGAWVCYCVSPVSALFHTDAKSLFDKGILNFVQKMENLGGNDGFTIIYWPFLGG